MPDAFIVTWFLLVFYCARTGWKIISRGRNWRHRMRLKPDSACFGRVKMAISYVLDRARGRMRTKVEGQVTIKDIMGHLDALCREDALAYVDLIDAVTPAGRFFLRPKSGVRRARC
jgi:hypothetical protein